MKYLRLGVRIVNTVLGLALVAVFSPSEPAVAHNYGSSNCGTNLELSNCVARDRYQYLYYFNLTSDVAYAVEDTSHYVFRDRTDLEMYRTLSAGSNVDAWLYDGNYGSGYWGVTFCPSGALQGGTNPNRWCQGFTVRFNNGYYPTRWDSVFERDVLTCHELGHTTGLRDRDWTNVYEASCMIDNAYYSDYLSVDDEAHLNSRY
jgi:hypothetical protein